MFSAMILPMILSASVHATVPVGLQSGIVSVNQGEQRNVLVAQYYKAGPDHGPDPHNEIHDYGLPAHPNWSGDPYGGTQGNISDPYGGTQGYLPDPYDGTAPYAPY